MILISHNPELMPVIIRTAGQEAADSCTAILLHLSGIEITIKYAKSQGTEIVRSFLIISDAAAISSLMAACFSSP